MVASILAAFPARLPRRMWDYDLLTWVGLFAAGALVLFALTYAIFQAHLCNGTPCMRPASRLFFYPTLPLTRNYCCGQRWMHVVDPDARPYVYFGAVPLDCLGHYDTLQEFGVRGIVNMCYEYEGRKDILEARDIEQCYLPTVDHEEPSLEAIKKGVEFIYHHTSRGHSVYIHCKGGRGRSAAVAFAWLLVTRRQTLADTQALINKQRRVRKYLYLQRNIERFYSELRDGSYVFPPPASSYFFSGSSSYR